MNVVTRKYAQTLSNELQTKLNQFRFYVSLPTAGYGHDMAQWHGTIPDGWAHFPLLESQRSRVFTGSAESFAYNHHQSICKFRDRYVVAWSCAPLHEDSPGQEVHCSWSLDAETWSADRVIVATDPASGVVRNQAGLYAAADYIYCFVGYTEPHATEQPGMTSVVSRDMRLDVYRSSDLETWEGFQGIAEQVYLFEGPRPTREGKLLCCGTNHANREEASMLIWDDGSLTASPRVVHVSGAGNGLRPHQGTWYQTDDGRIWMWQRDGGNLTRLGLTWSDDGGETWSEMVSSDFPNTFSRAHAGRLDDGRCYLIGNNFDQFLNRLHMQIAISDDGACFDRMYTLLQGNTTRRVPGQHKEDGYHYPNSMVDADRLLVTYSVNKEDIEVAVVDVGSFV